MITSQHPQPTRTAALLFYAKSRLLCLRRWLIDPHPRPTRLLSVTTTPTGEILAESRSPLYPATTSLEFALQAGKVQNLRIAASHLHGRQLPAGVIFSFWANVPRPTPRRGFAKGRELRSGCVIPSIGGGLCQVSNALYDAALTAGFEILERHAHSRSLPGSTTANGRDATIFWNYVDLRFRATIDCQLEVEISATELAVRIRAATNSAPATRPAAQLESQNEHIPESCETCGVTSCFRNPVAASLVQHSSTAWLVDAWFPEFDTYMRANRKSHDTLLTPLSKERYRISPYLWPAAGFQTVRSAPWFVFQRSLISRQLQTSGARRQQAHLQLDAKLSRIYAKYIPVTALHLVVSQNLVPMLWQSGALAGRTYDVLMTRLPVYALHHRLDQAAQRWPDTVTLTDFRADPSLVKAEEEALSGARHWITPHTAIAALAGHRAILLDWHLPPASQIPGGRNVVFPASTLARKGANELREALADLNLPLQLLGPVLEGADFWKGQSTIPASEDWLNDAALLVLPAWVEHQPRRLLKALAAGIPVICTPACGLPPQPGLTLVPEGDTALLSSTIQSTYVSVLTR